MSTNTKNPAVPSTSLEYLQKAYTHYTNIVNDFNSSVPYYWPCGCVINSMIDFLRIACPLNIVSYTDGRDFLKKVSASYLLTQQQGAWYDDWAWWGTATAKIFDVKYNELLCTDEALKSSFLTICTQTFRFVKTGVSPYRPVEPTDSQYYVGTENAYNYIVQQAGISPAIWNTYKQDYEPVWNIGCWQAPIGPGYDPSATGLGPFQDSVINGLYYNFIQRTLGQTGHDAKGFLALGTQAEVDMMTQFYTNWMGEGIPSLSDDQKLFHKINLEAGIFRERVSVYKNGSLVNGYDPSLFWMGDQGLMLAALTQRYHSGSGTAKQNTLSLILQVVRGAFTVSLASFDSFSNVIMPWCHTGLIPPQQPGTPPGYDYSDYYSGTGIFMRGLLEAISIPEVKSMVEDYSQDQSALLGTIAAFEAPGNVYLNHVFGIHGQENFVPMFDEFNKMTTYLLMSQVSR